MAKTWRVRDDIKSTNHDGKAMYERGEPYTMTMSPSDQKIYTGARVVIAIIIVGIVVAFIGVAFS